MEVTLRKAADLARAAKAAAAQITIEADTSVSVHAPDPVAYVQQREQAMIARIDDWRTLIDAHYLLRDLIGKANAQHGVSSLLARKAFLDEQEKFLTARTGSDAAARRERQAWVAYGSAESAVQPGHEDGLPTLQQALDAMRRRLETVTQGDARQRVTIPALSNSTITALKRQIRDIRQQRATHLESIARINVTQHITIDGTLLDTLRRFELL